MASAGRILPLYKDSWTSGNDYDRMDNVLYQNSTYVAKNNITNSTTPPSTDTTNWQMTAKGFIGSALSDIDGVDTNGLLGTPGSTVTSQTLINKFSDHIVDSDTKINSILEDYLVAKYNSNGIVFGEEYLSAFHKKIISDHNMIKYNLVFSGDSTTSGVSTTSSEYHIDQLIKDIALSDGMPYINSVNNGHSAADTEHWNTTYYQTDLDANPDLLILRWGINDPYYAALDNQSLGDSTSVDPAKDALRRKPSDFETSLRSGLTKIRASKSQSQLSIILMAPNSVSDDYNGRNEEWIESIVPIIKKAARDFKCCFINTYQLLQDSRSASDYMDSPYSDFRHIHPLDVMNLWIANTLYEVIFPTTIRAKYGSGNLLNVPSTDVLKSLSDAPSTYPMGISFYRTSQSPLTFPVNGGIATFKSVDGIVFQINSGYQSSGLGMYIRYSLVMSDAWSGFYAIGATETATRPTLQNSWVDYNTTLFSQAEYYKSSEGMVYLQGLIKSGTTTVGTTIFTLPTGYRPIVDRFFIVASNTGAGMITVGPTGEVKYQAGGNGYLSLDGVVFRAYQ